jgi:hypothetical protein
MSQWDLAVKSALEDLLSVWIRCKGTETYLNCGALSILGHLPGCEMI